MTPSQQVNYQQPFQKWKKAGTLLLNYQKFAELSR
jgi:hypothetical protein